MTVNRLLTLLAGLAVLSLQAQAQGLPDDPSWGRSPHQPSAANAVFATADGCALCHSEADKALAMRGQTGEDISPFGLWQATMMANSFRDPYWRAQVAREIEAKPEQARETQALCVTCHAPMAHHTARIAGFASQTVHEMEGQGLAEDGVSCTVCHQAQPDNLGTPESFSGNLDIRPGRVIFGPFSDPAGGPMRMHSAFTPTEGAHIRSSALCGACHTLETKHAPDAAPFLEQGPYVEWLNSDYADGGAAAQSCQECHMPAYGPTRIARAPFGGDFNIAPREGYRGHAFYGGNAFMLDILAKHREELGVEASVENLERAARATRIQLAERTATAELENAVLKDGRATFDIRITNLTGHKLPSGYPSRRMWLMVEVYNGRDRIFVSGEYDERGRLAAHENELGLPHVDVVRARTDVPIWEATALDAKGQVTTLLTAMASYGKDNRILPRGWRPDGPMAERTQPVGIGDDKDFSAGSDTVHYEIAAPEATRLRVVTRLLYQPIPPAWAAATESVEAAEAQLFNRIYQGVSPTPDIVSLSVRFIDG